MSVAYSFARFAASDVARIRRTRFGRARISYRSQVEETETVDNLISNIEELLGRVGDAVDPDLARLRAAVYAGIDHVRENAKNPGRKRAPVALWGTVAIFALSSLVVALWMHRTAGE